MPCPPPKVAIWGGNKKHPALRLDVENFFWGSECWKHQTGITDVYKASNNELVVHTKTLVRNRTVLTDSTSS